MMLNLFIESSSCEQWRQLYKVGSSRGFRCRNDENAIMSATFDKYPYFGRIFRRHPGLSFG